MSIDPTKSIQPLAPASRTPSAGRNQGGADGRFAEALETANARTEPKQVLVAQASAAMQMAQLQLLQGLFGGDEDEGGEGLFAGFFPLGGQPQQIAPQRQKLDSLYTKLQPTLLETPKSSRSDIEQLIDRVAAEVSLAPELIRSVVAAESNFDPQAVSPVGARGLMQLMPATAAELGVSDSHNPEQNLLGGSRYLKQLLDKYDGNLDKALAAYNWGQGNVDRKGLARMPEETRNYVAKIKGLLERA